ncbi:MAG TPA: hypothetical protein VLS90_21350 [Thermodesulfobacteriota bacterium]|nr:hypothetical protein [Thermodesulfobacteriota bacterium]
MKTLPETRPEAGPETTDRGAPGARVPAPEIKKPADPYSRTYGIAFKDFHPRINQALQKYSRENPGNSFQVSRLGSDLVAFRGLMKSNGSALFLAIQTSAAGSDKSRIEIRPPEGQAGPAAEKNIARLFDSIEAELGVKASE